MLLSSTTDPAVKNDIIQALIAQSEGAKAKAIAPAKITTTTSQIIMPQVATTKQIANATATTSTSEQMTEQTPFEKENIFHVWKENEEDFLVDLRHETHDEFKKIKNHTKLWSEISNKINEELGCGVTANQCLNKYNSLKQKWKEIIDAPSGSEAKYFRLKTSFDNIFGNKASTKPANIIDTFSDELKGENVKEMKKGKGLKRKNEVLELVDKQYNEFKTELQKQHNEIMQRMDQFLALYAQEIGAKGVPATGKKQTKKTEKTINPSQGD